MSGKPGWGAAGGGAVGAAAVLGSAALFATPIGWLAAGVVGAASLAGSLAAKDQETEEEALMSGAKGAVAVVAGVGAAIVGKKQYEDHREGQGWKNAKNTAKMEYLPGTPISGAPPAFLGPIAKRTNLAPVHTYVESQNAYTGEVRRHEKQGKWPMVNTEDTGRHLRTDRYHSPGRGTAYDYARGDERKIAKEFDDRQGHYNLLRDNCEYAANGAMQRVRS